VTRPRISYFGALLALAAMSPGTSFALDADASRQEVGRELGSVLAWRLMPEIVESSCREADPAGADARKQALQAWLDKNANLIKSVDERVAEVAPLAFRTKEGVDTVQLIRRQVGGMVKQSLFGEKSAEELATICKAEANPASPRWNNNGMPQVANALAALYDWKVQLTAH
jgi:hypothetical protein